MDEKKQEQKKKKRRTIGLKVLGMLVGLGVLMTVMVVLNILALNTIGEYNGIIEEKIVTYEQAVDLIKPTTF